MKSRPSTSSGTNRLIDRLPRNARESLLKVCVAVELQMAQVLCQGGKPLRYIFFPTTAYLSMMTLLEGKAALEVGLVGFEGLLGSHTALGYAEEPLRAVVQGPGTAWRVEMSAFKRELSRNRPLRESVAAYLHVTIGQLATAATCQRFHRLAPRLARWLLMVQDRTRRDEFYLTHELLALMLGVRRVGVTESASILQRKGLVKYSRGNIAVLDRPGLMQVACSCYSVDRAAYRRLL